MIANKKILLLILLICVFTTTMVAQSNRSLPFLEVNSDTRTSGMGNTNMGESESMYLYTNPTSIFHKEDKFYSSYSIGIYPEIENNRQLFHTVSAGFKIADKHALMIGLRSLSGYEVISMDEEGGLESLYPIDKAIDLAYTLQITPNFSTYFGGSYIHSDLGKVATTLGLNAGAYYYNQYQTHSNYGYYTLGISINDLGGKVKYGNDVNETALPTSIGFGGSLLFPIQTNHSIQVALTNRYYMLPSDASEFSTGLGLEYELFNTVSLRTGYFWSKEMNYLTMGLGCNIKSLRLDAAYQKGNLNNLYQLGAHIQF
ncbi:MAG: PorV/PorQ family protein [Dysgonamonadaceae bacterium]